MWSKNRNGGRYPEVNPPMITKKQCVLLFCVFLFAVMAYRAQPAEALPFDNEYTDELINAGAYVYDNFVLTAGQELNGYFETSVDTDGIDFFICDSVNFTVWDLGGSATGYEIATNMHTNYFSFTAPYSGDWYAIFDNTGGSTAVTIDAAIDLDSDNTPSYSSYDYTGYGDVLEDNEYEYVALTLGAGAIIDGNFATFFSTDGIDFFICNQADFNDWESGYSITQFNHKTDMHVASIDSYTTPAYDTYYCVFFAQSEIDTVTFSYGIDVNTSGVTSIDTGGLGSGITAVGLIAAVLILGILCCVCRSKKKEPEYAPPTVDHYRAPPSTPTESTVIEREIVRDRVLVICPYCGAKNEQGVLTCHNCKADL